MNVAVPEQAITIERWSEVFVPGFDDVVRFAGSDRTLHAAANLSEVAITDTANQHHHFRAEQIKTGGEDALYFSIDTQDRAGQNVRHPDLRAAQMMGASVVYFENKTRGGRPIPRIAATWFTEPGASDNYTEYKQNLDRLGLGHEAEAAADTWTGRTLERLGFTIVSSVHAIEDDFLEVYFDRRG